MTQLNTHTVSTTINTVVLTVFVCGSRESSEKRGMFSATSVDRQSATLPRHRRTTPTPPHTKNDTTQTTIHTAVHRLYQKRPRAGISSCTRRMTRSEKPLSAICICALSAKNPRRSSSSTLPLLLIKFLSSFIRLCSFSYYLLYPFFLRNIVSFSLPLNRCDFTVPTAMPVISAI